MTRKTGRILCLVHGSLGINLFLHRYLNGLALRAYPTSISVYNFSHTYGLIGIHGSRPRFSRGTNRTLCELEESEQVGLYRRCRLWVLCWDYRVAGHDSDSERLNYQRHCTSPIK